ncbi:MucB/RseB C-terminal domain-containing protein [Kushneria phosphatilytica]|uniref:Uncharacterized protein n=1 Tax=Kushneria phosphatilytica TaxID=657387 RepID=A0A1S1NWL9_9GAMM|nr:MucB/RseB C-terminal domain-containing protein [Kushneria phosphatilytica]OHV11827.1 hypothetical protein BH688_03780 [Kushneria phosphatilytica]QEL10993.1 hypothetical protein FY550_07535 [Kushneria phosphatilytica]
MRRWFGASLLGALLSGLPLAVLAGESIDCGALKDQPRPRQASQWFANSIVAGRCYEFRARAMRIGPGGIRTVEIEHRVDHQGEQETTRFLDGPHPDTRRNLHLDRYWQVASEALDRANGKKSDAVAAMQQHYRFRTIGHDRIADRETVVIDIIPRDGLRFGHRIWLDQATSLLLKQQLFGQHGEPLEVVQMASLNDVSLFSGQVPLPGYHPLPEKSWSPQWIPPGFYPQPVDSEVTVDGITMHRQLYSDGLSTLSVFLGPINQSVSLREGVHQLGNFRAASRHLTHDQQTWQLVAVGEVPTEVLTHTVAGIDWSPDPARAARAASASASDTSP